MLKEERLKKGMQQKQLAKKLLISNCYLSKLENHPHKCNPTVKLILKIAEQLELEHIDIYTHFIENIKKVNTIPKSS